MKFQEVQSTGAQGGRKSILKDFVISASAALPGRTALNALPSPICPCFLLYSDAWAHSRVLGFSASTQGGRTVQWLGAGAGVKLPKSNSKSVFFPKKQE